MSFLTLGNEIPAHYAGIMTIEQSADMYTWADVKNASVHEIFPGINARPLWKGDNGAKSYVLEMAPNSKWQGIDVHEPGPEEVYVISGVFNDGDRDYPAGSFIHAPAGSSHVPQTVTGCTLFLFYPEG